MKPHTFRYKYTDILNQTIEQMVNLALDEDINRQSGGEDITAQLVPQDKVVQAKLRANEAGVMCGKKWFEFCFHLLDSNINIEWSCDDAQPFDEGQILCTISGKARAILTAERSAMNFLQTLSGTATQTASYVKMLSDQSCRLLDTRKTLPGFRLAQKYAVVCGGGYNHRIGLFDAYLIKENHIRACGNIALAVKKARELHPEAPIEVEVENLDELEQALACSVEVIMLDNFSNSMKCKAVEINAGRSALEASGDITLDSISSVAKTGVDYISVGAITKNIQAIDLSLLIQ